MDKRHPQAFWEMVSLPSAMWIPGRGTRNEQTVVMRTKKYQDFVSEPMGDKPITAVDGIDDELGAKLAAKGFDKAYILLGQFLLLKKECAAFQSWLKSSFDANSSQAEQCALCLLEWSYAFL
nr:barrier-to-autointegration factor-like protein [Anolis sagrei ordinatus]